jgi:hypothetical protein
MVPYIALAIFQWYDLRNCIWIASVVLRMISLFPLILTILTVNIFSYRLVQNGGKENLLVQNMYLLLDLMSFFDAYDQKQYRQAILIIKQLGIVPVEADKISQAVSGNGFYFAF